jgi:hypothetical protein
MGISSARTGATRRRAFRACRRLRAARVSLWGAGCGQRELPVKPARNDETRRSLGSGEDGDVFDRGGWRGGKGKGAGRNGQRPPFVSRALLPCEDHLAEAEEAGARHGSAAIAAAGAGGLQRQGRGMAGRDFIAAFLPGMMSSVDRVAGAAVILAGQRVGYRGHARRGDDVERRALGAGTGHDRCEEMARGKEKRQPRCSRHCEPTVADGRIPRQAGGLSECPRVRQSGAHLVRHGFSSMEGCRPSDRTGFGMALWLLHPGPRLAM